MTKWYLYVDEEVIGPFTKDQLRERLDEETLVCEAGSEDWQSAKDVPELTSLLASEEQASPNAGESASTPSATPSSTRATETAAEAETKADETIEPTLESLQSICERADNDDLMEQYEQHWEKYDSEERRVILAEIDNRGLLN